MTRNDESTSSTNIQISPILTFLGVIAAIYFFRDILILFVISLAFTFLLSPAVNLLTRYRFPHVPAVILTAGLALGVVFIAATSIGYQLVDVVDELPSYRHNIQTKIDALNLPSTGPVHSLTESIKVLSKEIGMLKIDPAELTEDVPPPRKGAKRVNPLPVQVVQTPPSAIAYLEDLAKSLATPIGSVGLVVIFTIFMLLEREKLRNRLLLLAGMGQLNVVTEALDDATRRVSRYVLMQFLVNLSFGLLFGTGLYFIGLPQAFLWGIVAGLLRVVPYVGSLIATSLPLLLSLAVFNSWIPPLLVLSLAVLLELVAANFVEPWLYGAQTGISSLALLVSAVFWGFLWGPVGLVLATPLTVCLVVLGRYFPQLSFLYVLLGEDPELAPEARLYQRLLAKDAREARALVQTVLRDSSLTELYDSLLLPTLSLAEQDRHRGVIDGKREQFLYLTINEFIAEFSESLPRAGAAAENRHIRVLCLPASDQADEITAALLAQALEHNGYTAVAFPQGSTLQEISTLEPGEGDIVCVVAIPPYALAPTKALCKQVQSAFPDLRVTSCVSGFDGASDEGNEARSYVLNTTIAQTLQQIYSWDVKTVNSRG